MLLCIFLTDKKLHLKSLTVKRGYYLKKYLKKLVLAYLKTLQIF